MRFKFFLFALISMQSIFCIDEDIIRQIKVLGLRINLCQLSNYFNRTLYYTEDGIVRNPESNKVFYQGVQVLYKIRTDSSLHGIQIDHSITDSTSDLIAKKLTPDELRDKLSDDSCKSCEKADEYATYGCGAVTGFYSGFSGNPICCLFCLTLGVGNFLKRAKYKEIAFGNSNADVKQIIDETVDLYRELHQGGPVQQNAMR